MAEPVWKRKEEGFPKDGWYVIPGEEGPFETEDDAWKWIDENLPDKQPSKPVPPPPPPPPPPKPKKRRQPQP